MRLTKHQYQGLGLEKLNLAGVDRLPTASLVQQLVGAGAQANERRRHIRYRIQRDVVCIPLDERAHPLGVAETARLIDLSASGAKLMVEEPWEASMILIDCARLGMPETQLLGEIRWEEKENRGYSMGCKFLLGSDGQLPLA
ncbi:PilZ domain protein [Aeoliella mucimassa]|uniref:PilZ domain protein n=2 Tax=Aeoliella mucimassa TaxID=2527972 RepID=A0A518AKA3_9BACT|nr:PilZ domain protein [Aeoliella mucimassa]